MITLVTDAAKWLTFVAIPRTVICFAPSVMEFSPACAAGGLSAYASGGVTNIRGTPRSMSAIYVRMNASTTRNSRNALATLWWQANVAARPCQVRYRAPAQNVAPVTT